ncbi:MAG: SDR family oxidoreductase, partial [Bacteroidia bacterium]|nr:SDR family oxidoreductase [Bacteroidia bacterium]
MVILILGVSKGIGLETAKYLLADHQVIGISRNPLSFSHPHLHYIQGDIKDTATLETCVQYLKNNNLSIDVMINNAGILIYQAFEHITPSELNETFHTNVLAPFIWIQNMLPYLKKSKVAHIVNISSMGGITGTQ